MFSSRDARTLLDKLVTLLSSITRASERKVLLVADACYASGKVILPLLAKGHQLLTRAKSNAVAYLPFSQPTVCGKGRPRTYGTKVRLKDLAHEHTAFICAPSPVYGEHDVTVRLRVLDLVWRPVGRIVRFCIVHHPVRGTIFLLSTDTTLEPLACIAQGLLLHLAINHTAEVWRCFRSWLRTMNPARPPSELIVANALRSTIPALFSVPSLAHDLAKIITKYRRHDPPSDTDRIAA